MGSVSAEHATYVNTRLCTQEARVTTPKKTKQMVVCIHGRNVINANSVARVLVIQVIFCTTLERIQERSLIDAMTVECIYRIQEIVLDMLEKYCGKRFTNARNQQTHEMNSSKKEEQNGLSCVNIVVSVFVVHGN